MRVLLIDDHSMFREGLELLLKRISADVTVLHARNVDEGLEFLAAPTPPDLIFTDLVMPGLQGLEALIRLRAAKDSIPVVVLAGSEDADQIRAAINHGAMGYILKSSPSQELARAFSLVLNDSVYLPAIALSTEPTERQHARQTMTPRQLDVLRLLVRGLTNKSIARVLQISDETVKKHVASILQLLAVSNRTQAVYAVARLGIRLQ